MNEFEDEPTDASRAVGRRLRAVRRALGLSLDEVERRSDGRWSASAVGAYERGFRNLSLPRLRELAGFYDVSMAALLGEDTTTAAAQRPSRVVLDLVALRREEASEPIARYLRSILLERGDFNGQMMSIRRNDINVLCALQQCSEPELFALLRSWNVLIENTNGQRRVARRP
ncbi:MAG: transcriptional regulator [Acidimicrobiia bacterium]